MMTGADTNLKINQNIGSCIQFPNLLLKGSYYHNDEKKKKGR